MIIPRNKINVETGILISKIPYDENLKVTYEFYAWLGRRIKPIITKSNYSDDYIRVRVKVLTLGVKAIKIETKLKKHLWVPKSLIKSNNNFNAITTGEWYNIEITRWFYKGKDNIFGIT